MGEKIAWYINEKHVIEMNNVTCTLCKGPHMTRKCPDLHDPLKEGFHSGGNGGQGHSHDEEDSAHLLEGCAIVKPVERMGCVVVSRKGAFGLSVQTQQYV